MICFHHQTTFEVLPSSVILTPFLSTRQVFFFRSDAGTWRTHPGLNCSIYATSTIYAHSALLHFVVFLFLKLNSSLTDSAVSLVLSWHRNTILRIFFLRKILSSICLVCNIHVSGIQSSLLSVVVFDVTAVLIMCSITNSCTGQKLYTHKQF